MRATSATGQAAAGSWGSSGSGSESDSEAEEDEAEAAPAAERGELPGQVCTEILFLVDYVWLYAG